MNILIIEDDANVVVALKLCLQIRWPEVSIAASASGLKGVDMARSQLFDIILLDLNLPDTDGLEVLRRIRLFSNIPIIIVSVRGGEDDQTKGLELGADDYIVKPFRPRDLVARVNSVLRRSHVSEVAEEAQSIIRGELTLRLANNEAQLREETIKLTPNESKLLYVLMTKAEDTLSSEKILEEVWGRDFVTADVVRTYVRRLRNKLKDNPPQIILNQRRAGYRFVSPI